MSLFECLPTINQWIFQWCFHMFSHGTTGATGAVISSQVQQGQEQLARSVELQQEQMPELLQRIRRAEIHGGDVLIIEG